MTLKQNMTAMIEVMIEVMKRDDDGDDDKRAERG